MCSFRKHFPHLHNLAILDTTFLVSLWHLPFSCTPACFHQQYLKADCLQISPIVGIPEMSWDYQLILGSSINYWLAE